MNNETITIPLSKKKISLLIGLGLVMTAVALWLIVAYDGEWSRMSQTSGKIAGFVGVVFFAAATVFGFVKLFDKRPGLLITPEGIADNSSAVSGLFIKWQDVKNLRVEQVATSRFLLIEVTNPEAYLSTVSGFRQKLLQLNHKTYGTPIAIASNSLVYSFDDLVRLLQARWALYQQSQRTPNL